MKLSVTNGMLYLGSNSALTADTGEGTSVVNISGTLAALDAALGGLSYYPSSANLDADTLALTITDNGNSQSASASVPISVVLPPAPTFAPGFEQVAAAGSGAQSIADWASEIVPAAVDPAGSNLSFSVTANQPSLFLVQPVLSADGMLTYTPAASSTGTATATLTITLSDNDGSATDGSEVFSLIQASIVIAGEAPPTAADVTYSVLHDQTLTVDAADGALAGDTAAAGYTLSTTSMGELADDATPTANGEYILDSDGSFEYIPNPGFVGDDTFTYQTTDGFLTSGVATVTIQVTDQAPTVTASQHYSTSHDHVLELAPSDLGDSDADGDALTRVLVDSSGNQLGTTVTTAHGTVVLNPDYSFSYAPSPGYTGPDSFEYEAFDGAEYSTIATVNICVTNTAPEITDDSPLFDVPHDRPFTVSAAVGLVANGSDADGDQLQAALDTAPTHGSVSVASDGSFTYTPGYHYTGQDSFTYTLSDGFASAEGTVFLNVYDTPPVVTDLSYYYYAGDQSIPDQSSTVTVGASNGILAYAYDADGDSLSVIYNSYSGLPATVNADGSFSAQTSDGDSGATAAPIQFIVSDGLLQSDGYLTFVRSWSPTLTDLNGPPPVAPPPTPSNSVGETYQAFQGETLNVTANSLLPPLISAADVAAGMTAVQTGPMYQVGDDLPGDYGAYNLNSDGTFSFTPTQAGEYGVPFAEENAAGVQGATIAAMINVSGAQVTKAMFRGSNGIHDVVSDEDERYNSTWSGVDEADPLVFTAGDNVFVKPTFSLSNVPSGAKVTFTGDEPGPNGTWITEFSGALEAVDTMGTYTVAAYAESKDPITADGNPGDAGIMTLTIRWQVTFADQTLPAGTTQDKAYLTWSESLVANPFETSLNVGCAALQGVDLSDLSVTDAANLIFSAFEAGANGSPIKNMEGTPLTYWASWNGGNVTTSQLLDADDGDGQCGAWANFFINVARTQGLSEQLQGGNSTGLVSVYALAPGNRSLFPSPTTIMMVKQWNFGRPTGTGFDAGYPYQFVGYNYVQQGGSWVYKFKSADGTYQPGVVPGQGNSNPKSTFQDHALVLLNGVAEYFDPSYGKIYDGSSVVAGELAFQSQSLSAVGYSTGPIVMGATGQDFRMKLVDPTSTVPVVQFLGGEYRGD